MSFFFICFRMGNSIDVVVFVYYSCLAMTLQRYKFEMTKDANDVGMEMGATIHTAGGLPMKVSRR